MKLSIFTTQTNSIYRGDTLNQSMDCYTDLADEVVMVNGGDSRKEMAKWRFIDDLSHYEYKEIESQWPQEFDWPVIGQQFQRGYEACTGDVVIHADLDFIWHEKDFFTIRQAAQTMLDNHYPAMSMWKYQFILPDRYNLKSRLVVMVNKRDFGDRIKFDSGKDLCQPSLDGKELSPNDVAEARVAIYNYEKLLKTKDQISEDQGRMERAWHRHFGEYQMGSDGTNEGALERWIRAQEGKFKKPQQAVKYKDHPKYIKETIKNLTPDQFGYSGFGMIKGGVYAQGDLRRR